ncbi:MAG: ABC transporter ATP-binding protein [Bacteroidota bacterium]
MPAADSKSSARYVAERLCVDLGGRRVLDALTLRIAPGTVTALVGPNGSGKTTLLRTLTGLLPHEGTLTLDGTPLRGWSDRDRARALAYVQQRPSLAFDLTVRAFVALGRTPHRSWIAGPSDADRAAVAHALATTRLTPFADRSARTLSGGEHRRLLLAQALAQDTPLLLLDEPTAHLDLRHVLDLAALLQGLHADGRTLVVALHELDLAARLADQVLLLHQGRLVAAGPPVDVLTPPNLEQVFGVAATVTPTADGLHFSYHTNPGPKNLGPKNPGPSAPGHMDARPHRGTGS